MQKSKNFNVIIILLSVIIIAGLIAVLVLYFTTDIFKSKEEMFQRYMLQEINNLNNLVDISKETEYRKILEENDFNENWTIDLKYTDNEGKIYLQAM